MIKYNYKLISIQDETRQNDASARWLAISDEYKVKVKSDIINTLSSPVARVGSIAAQVVAAIAAIELPKEQWQDLITNLLGAVNTGDLNTRIATLQCIGFICESIVITGAFQSYISTNLS